MLIESELGKGTKIILSFPQITSPDWLCTNIEFYEDEAVIILDDDEDIHKEWEIRFKTYNPAIKLTHFKHGDELVYYVNNLHSSKKDKVFLLADHRLLKQDLQGLDLIRKTQIKNSVLVTNHYCTNALHHLAKSLNIKILPKVLASEICITNIKSRH